jgi:predicted alpha/beta hydrolase family esterase
MTLPNILIIHGNGGGTGNDQWIPWLKAQLQEKGFTVQNPTMPDNIEAKASVWLPYIKDELKAGPDTIIVGWSSGAVVAMRYAEQNKIKGSVLIGTNHTDLNNDMEKISGYYDKPWDWDAIKNNQEWIALFASQDDPFIPVEEARFIKEKLQPEYYEFTNKGHFGHPIPMPEFPEVLEIIVKRFA